jgi:hypothetical protein
MTEQENRTLGKLVRQIQQFGDMLSKMDDRLNRVERGLLGDQEYEIVGLIDDHKALKAEVKEIKAQVQSMSLVHGALRKLPYFSAAAIAFYWQGGDLGAVIRLLEGLVR